MYYQKKISTKKNTPATLKLVTLSLLIIFGWLAFVQDLIPIATAQGTPTKSEVQADIKAQKKILWKILAKKAGERDRAKKTLKQAHVKIAKMLEPAIQGKISGKSIELTNANFYGDGTPSNLGITGSVVFSTAGKSQAGKYSLGLANLIPETSRGMSWVRLKSKIVDQFMADKGIDKESWYVPDSLPDILRPMISQYVTWSKDKDLCDLGNTFSATGDLIIKDSCFGYPNDLSTLPPITLTVGFGASDVEAINTRAPDGTVKPNICPAPAES